MIRVAKPPAKPILIFDDDCTFCRRWVARWRRITGDRVEYLPFQDPQIAERFPEIQREACERSVQFIASDGSMYEGAEAAFRASGSHAALWAYREVPGFATTSEWFYRLVANHRAGFSAFTQFFWGKHVEPPTYLLTRWVFLRMLGMIHLIAFVSLWTQISGLVGTNGITPAAELMNSANNWVAAHHAGEERYWLLPTLCWFSVSDAFLNGLCASGVVLSMLVIVGIAPTVALFLLWLIYLSLLVVCREFLSFQWDILLLETTFLAIFFAPLRLWPKFSKEEPIPKLALWMLRWLLFRLMFTSGLVKLLSGDVLWHGLTALTKHYETQPLPTWIGWYAHQLPASFQKFSCGVMFVIELGAPFLIFGSRWMRHIAAAAFAFLMLLIMLTGNYCFFNLLALALCVTLLDDNAIRWWWKGNRPEPWMRQQTTLWLGRVRFVVFAPIAAAIFFVTVLELVSTRRTGIHWPQPVLRKYYEIYQAIQPFHSVNRYGLFAVMTPTRPEIIVEGSNDGLTWVPYEFKYKPGDLKRRPQFVEPHQPRLDWQMWFAALGDYENNPWFVALCAKLLKGSPQVEALLAKNPFPDAPPRYIRAMLYDYRFTDFATRRATGQWWRRELIRPYCPILSLNQ